MEPTPTCLSFNIPCDVMFTGIGVVLAGFILFVGSIYVLLAAVFGRWMGYLVLTVAFSGWMIIQSSIWLFGYWSLGPDTPVNLGPRGQEAAWTVVAAGIDASGGDEFEDFAFYPASPWEPVQGSALAESEPQAIQGAAVTYLAEEANRELDRATHDLDAVTASQFAIDTVATARAADGTDLAVVQAHFTGGGPVTTVSMAFDQGNVASYGWMFFIGSIALFAIHVPLLDRAERSRKEFLTGGGAPVWYGPA